MPTLPGIERPRQHQRRVSPWWLLTAALWLATPVWAQEPWTWAPIADLNQPRAEHTATLLANGTVLIAGGRDAAGQPLASAEIYDPATGAYTLLASPLPAPVWGHTANRLSDGTVLIAGGTGDGGLPVAAAQLFDPATGAFTALDPLSTPRARHTATLLRDGRVVLVGGTDGVEPLASLEVYDPTTRTFSLAPSALVVPRQDHTATLLPDRRVLIAGGSNASGALDSAELYDPTAGTVSPAGPLSVPRTLASAALLLDGTALVAGGQTTTSEDLDSAEVYDAATNAFTPLPAPMGTARSGHLGVQLLDNGKVLISGGTSGGQLVPSAEVYDPVTGAFQPVDSPVTARRLFGANFFQLPYTGILLATGGLDSAETPLASSEVFFYPTLRSDKADYAPGEIVTLMGEGWRPNETIAINIHESSGDPDTNLTATADASGAFTNSEFQINPDRSDIGVRFLATATGQASWWTAQARFTDNPKRITGKDHEGQKKVGGVPDGYTNGNVTQYTEGDTINFRFTLEATHGPSSGKLEVRFTGDDGTCLFFANAFTLGTVEAISGSQPTVSVDSGPTATDFGTSSGEWVVVLDINFAGTFGHDDPDAIARVNYTLTLSDQAGDCNGSSQHSRLNEAGGDVKQTGAQNVPVPANQIVELPRITVMKKIDRNGNGSFESTAAEGEFCFSLDAGPCVGTDSSGTVVFTKVSDGEHTITETQLVFTQGTYTFDSGSGTNCTFSGSTATATVASGTTATDATCIFNNKKTAEQAKPVLKTQATAAGVVGLPISDTALLSGGSGTLGGTVTFTAFGPNDSDCSGSAAFTSSAIAVTPTIPGSGTATANFTPGTAGTYRWIASYTGDTNNAGISTNCNDGNETSEVAGPPPPSPEPSPDPTLTTVSCNPPTVQVNQPTTCTATVGSVIVGAPITTPTGAVSFFADASSTAFASCTLRATATTGVARCSVGYRTPTVGVHNITTSYPGDSTHVGSTVDTPFPVTVVPAVPRLGL